MKPAALIAAAARERRALDARRALTGLTGVEAVRWRRLGATLAVLRTRLPEQLARARARRDQLELRTHVRSRFHDDQVAAAHRRVAALEARAAALAAPCLHGPRLTLVQSTPTDETP